ncbi:hypothetical protein HanLR1_Chr14g0535861 [Helianthus annuus]|nr:hypothetical protein HanHA89_Chr14g0573451 [Helianthus annuus]KAJ0656440.1 hypothetical protein HanLR1_Chr14g0535861 [Helianthus annuus]
MVVSLQKIQVLQMFMILNIHADMETKKPTVRTYVKLWTDWAQVLISRFTPNKYFHFVALF